MWNNAKKYGKHNNRKCFNPNKKDENISPKWLFASRKILWTYNIDMEITRQCEFCSHLPSTIILIWCFFSGNVFFTPHHPIHTGLYTYFFVDFLFLLRLCTVFTAFNAKIEFENRNWYYLNREKKAKVQMIWIPPFTHWPPPHTAVAITLSPDAPTTNIIRSNSSREEKSKLFAPHQHYSCTFLCATPAIP